MADFTDVVLLDRPLEAFPRPDDITAYHDPTAPLLTFTPPGGPVSRSAEIKITATDDRALAILTVSLGDRVVYDGESFTSAYATSTATSLPLGGEDLTLRCPAGWPAGPFTIRAMCMDRGGNIVTQEVAFTGIANPLVVRTEPSAQGRPVADVWLFNTADGGEIQIVNGLTTMSDGLETAAYLSLFGGNEQDSGLSQDDSKQWWGNLSEDADTYKYRSETQYLLRALPATPDNLRKVEAAALRDTSWMTAEVASRIEARATMPRLNHLALTLSVVMKSGSQHNFTFTAPWGASA